MGLIRSIDHGIRKLIFSLFWWFIDPLEQERLFGELTDAMDRNLDASNPEQLMAPDHYDVSVNNTVFIKHAHTIKKLETVLQDRLQKHIAERDYEIPEPKIKLQIISSATISKHTSDIRCSFSMHENDSEPGNSRQNYQLKIIDGEGKGTTWGLAPGNTYKIGRISSADICLPYDNISKNQATLYFVNENNITIVDEESANGTFLNDETTPIKGSREIKLGGKIRFCKLNPIVLTLSEK